MGGKFARRRAPNAARPDAPDRTLLAEMHAAHASQLADSQETLRLAVEATGLGLWTYDVETSVMTWDQRMHAISGSPEPLTPEQWLDIVHPDDRDEVEASFRAMPTNRHVPHRILHPDGEQRWVLATSAATPQSEMPRVLRGGLLDITEQRVLEESLRRSQRLESLGNLSAGVAHNFNNMLAVIQSAIELVLPSADGVNAAVLADAARATRRAADLVAELMRFGDAPEPRRRAPVDLASLVDGAVDLCRRTFDRHIALRFDTARPLHGVRCNSAEIEQVVLNLLINSRDALDEAARPEPRIDISCRIVTEVAPDPGALPAPFACTTVTDNGTGMSAEVLSQIFDPFFTTKSPDRGSGLGLASSFRIARDHGGWLELSSVPGESTTARLYLPIHEGSVAQPETPAPVPPATLLLVDDEDAVRRVTASILRENGHTVMVAENAQAATELVRSAEPDVIFLDRSMPGWSSRRAVGELRSAAPGVPIVFFTGQSVPAEERQLVDGVLTKPVGIEAIASELDRLLKPRS